MQLRPGITCAFLVLLAGPVSHDALAQAMPALRLTEELRIDAAASDLAPITWIAVSPNGTIAVNQQQDGVVRFFDARGASLGTFGRKGQGPGEFQSLFRAVWVGDTLVVLDPNSRRLTFIAPDRTFRVLPWLQGVSVPGNPAASGRVISILPRAVLPDGSQLLTASMKPGDPAEWPGGAREGSAVVRVDRDGTLLRTLAWKPEVNCLGAGRAGDVVVTAIIPFCASPVDNVAPDGSAYGYVAVERSGSYRLVVVASGGDTLVARSMVYTPTGITSRVVDSVVESRTRNVPAQRPAWRTIRFPDAYPPIATVLIGRDGTIWLERYAIEGDRVWTVLDARGNEVGRVAVPRARRILVVSREAVWVTDADEDGLQSIVRYGVAR